MPSNQPLWPVPEHQNAKMMMINKKNNLKIKGSRISSLCRTDENHKKYAAPTRNRRKGIFLNSGKHLSYNWNVLTITPCSPSPNTFIGCWPTNRNSYFFTHRLVSPPTEIPIFLFIGWCPHQPKFLFFLSFVFTSGNTILFRVVCIITDTIKGLMITWYLFRLVGTPTNKK